MDLSITDKLNTCQYIFENYYILQNVTEKRALFNLKNQEVGSWIFRFDYINQKYFLTIKSNNLEYINHHVSYYCKRTDEVFILNDNQTHDIFSNLEDYLNQMTQIYNFDLTKQIVI
jgi:hypothetical protein